MDLQSTSRTDYARTRKHMHIGENYLDLFRAWIIFKNALNQDFQ